MRRYKGPEREITREELHAERAYGPYWYSGLWRIVRPLLVLFCSFLIAYGVLTGVISRLKGNYFDAVDAADPEEVAFSVRSGSSLTRVANDLENAGLIRNRTVFKYYGDFLGYGQKIQAGDYTLTRRMNVQEILDMLTTGDGKPLVRNITVIPGWTVEDIAAYLVKEGVIEAAADFTSLCVDGGPYSGYYYIQDVLTEGKPGRRYALEGYLAANTYEIYTDATADDIIRKLLSQTGTLFADEYFDRMEELSQKLGLTLNMDAVMTMASMIEKEAGSGDFARVSAVFYNRLRKNMTLGSDATVKYATGVTRLALTDSDTASPSPYNTYLNRGLPVGPICAPSPAAVYAALYPDETFMVSGQEYLYFCTKEPESGELYFSRTLEEHNRAVQIYRPLWEAYDQRMREGA